MHGLEKNRGIAHIIFSTRALPAVHTLQDKKSDNTAIVTMAFNCGPSGSNGMTETDDILHTHSVFGDGYSVKSRTSAGSQSMTRYRDEPEADYDEGATELYQHIENKDWDAALGRLESTPAEAKTWVSRREYGSDKTRWRLLPLHAVCIFRAPLALIEALIEVYPDGPKMKDDQGMLPIHLACRNGASKGVVLTLLTAFPESYGVQDRKGRVPADLVELSSSANKEVVMQSIKRFQKDMMSQTPKHPTPTSTRAFGGASVASTAMSQGATGTPVMRNSAAISSNEVDYEHRTVLFRLVLKKDWKAVVARASSFPEEAATWIVTKGFNGNLRFLPLHKACVLQPTEAVAAALVHAYPEGSKSHDQDGWLPIHCACFYGANEKVIDKLLTANPKGAQNKDDEGCLPLHYACLKGASQGVVDVLLASFAKGAMSKDDAGRLPIHHACSKGAPEGIVDALLKASPKGAQSKDDQGRLPLHHACRKNATERIIRTLLRVYPRGAQIKDDQDKLPVHYSCQNGASPVVVSLMLTTYPESINVKNGFGYTPLAEAKAMENPKMDPVIKVLEQFKKEQDKIKVDNGENAAFESQLNGLQEKVKQLEQSMAKVVDFGKDLKHDLKKNKDVSDVLNKFADSLMDLGGKNEKQALKTRQLTPSRSLFGRVKTAKAGK
jgi:ankyrin repeat protein